MIFDKLRLNRQLRKGGGLPAETDGLAEIAGLLRETGLPRLDRTTKDEIASQIGFKPVHMKQRHRLQFAGTLMALIVVSLTAQSATPGSPLYALKRVSEDARATVQPSFKQEIDDRRQSELEDMKRQQKASEDRIKQAEDDLQEARKRAEDAARDSSSGRSGSENKVDDNSGSSDVRGQSTGESEDRGNSGSNSGNSGSNSGSGQNRGRGSDD